MICNLFQECVFRVPGQSRGPGNWSPFGRSDSGRGSSNDVGQTESALGLKEENLVMTVGSIGVYKWGSLGCPGEASWRLWEPSARLWEAFGRLLN